MSAPASIGRATRHLILRAVKLSTRRLATGSHITRYSMYLHLEQVFQNYGRGRHARILSISHSERLASVVRGYSTTDLVEATYPEATLLDLPFAANEFDLVVSDQVLEHVLGDPQRAIDESRRVLKPGGLALHTTCLINPIHVAVHTPSDLWRFTPEALRWLCRDFSTIVDAGGWGNRFVWVAVALGLRYEPVPHAKWHPLHQLATRDEPRWPISTWIAAEK
jgi:SAM-dependent methyltransferase